MTAFVSSFSGAPVRRSAPPAASPLSAPRAALAQPAVLPTVPTDATMGSQVAPKIVLRDTGVEATCGVTVSFEEVASNPSAAAAVTANSALSAMLRRRGRELPGDAPAAAGPPDGVSAADFYYPKTTRNEAPVISLSEEAGLSVTYEAIDAVVGGVNANSTDSPAFWKQPTYKWAAMAASGPATTPETPEILSTGKYEKHFPTKTRNVAPDIKMRAPKGDWDTLAFLSVGATRVPFSKTLAQAVEKVVGGGVDQPDVGAAPVVAKYFSGDFSDRAPDVEVTRDSVSWKFVDVPADEEAAAALLAELRAGQ